jgi:hypothetical protein
MEPRILEHQTDGLAPLRFPHVAAGDPDPAGGRCVQAGHEAQERGLPHPAPADDGHDLTARDLESEIAQHGDRCVACRHVLHRDRRRHQT